MSANETYELAVRLRGEQIDETTADINEVEGEFDETADSVGESADEMEGFASRFDGAMTAIMAGFAVASAGLLSQVPVIGELMTGLTEVLSAVAFQMDRVLRPVLGPTTGLLFGLADAIFQADGAVGTLVGILGTLAVGFVTVLVPLAKLLTFTGRFATVSGVFRAAAGAMSGALVSLAGALGISTAALVGLLAVVGAVVAAFAVDFMGIRTATVNALQGAYEAVVNFGARLTGFFVGLVGRAIGWGRDMMLNFAQGIRDMAMAPIDAAAETFAGVADLISFDQRSNDRMAQRWGEDLLTHFSIGMETGVRQKMPSSDFVSGDSGPSRPATGGESVSVFLDGRKVNKGERRHRGSETSPRGRHS